MKQNKSILKIVKLLLVAILFFGVSMLSGCVKKSDDVYFLRSIVREHQIDFVDGNSAEYVTNDVGLDTEYEGVTISWKSSKPNLVSETGVVTLPTNDEEVELTATYTIGKNTKTKKFKLHLISQESIDHSKYIDALNKVLLLETRNNQTNYENAKTALNLVPDTHESKQSLNDRFVIQESIRTLDLRVKKFINLPLQQEYNHIMNNLNSLPQNNQYVVSLKNQVHELEPHLPVSEQVYALINNKNQLDYDNAVAAVESLPGDLVTKTSLNNYLKLVKEYLDNLALLNANNVDQDKLNVIVKQNKFNETITANEHLNLITIQNTNQQRLFNALPDLGYSYVDSYIESLKSKDALTQEEVSLGFHLVSNTSGDNYDELLSKLRVVILSKDITVDNLELAQDANELVASPAIKEQNRIIINDYSLVLNIMSDLIELETIKNSPKIDVDLLHDKIVALGNLGSTLEIQANKDWFANEFAMYKVAGEVIEKAKEILIVPLVYEGEDIHPLVQKISDTKFLNNSTVLSAETRLRNEFTELIEMNTLVRLEEIKASNESEKTDKNRELIGQLLGQTVSKDYGTYMIRSYKEKLDSEVRLSQSSKLVSKLLLIFVVIVVFFVSQAITADYASKKGYEGLLPSLISLIPIGGWIYFYKLPKRRNVSPSGIKAIYKPSEIIAKLLIYAQIVLTAIIVIVPIVYIFGMAFSNMKTDIPNQIWPTNPNWESFNYLFNETKFKTWWLNTVMIALINMLVGTILITGASYVFARFNFKGKKAGLMTILVLQSFPSFMGLIAMYVLFWKFGLLGQPLALTILYIGGGIPGNIWLIKGFMDQIPKDLDESAMIDGANKLQIFFKIIMPLAVPILTFVAVNMFMAPWMDYMLPGYLLNIPRAGAPVDYDITEQWTLAVGLFKLINDPNTLNYSAFAAGALIVGIPITLLYMFFQKYLIEGIMAGATKG